MFRGFQNLKVLFPDFLFAVNILHSPVSFGYMVVQKTSFMLFLNKFDIFEKKVLDVRAYEL